MSEFAESAAVQFLLGCVGVAVVVFSLLGGLALMMHNGQAQSCASSGGHWNATDNPVTEGGSGGVDRVRECVR